MAGKENYSRNCHHPQVQPGNDFVSPHQTDSIENDNYHEVLPEDKVLALTEAFSGYKEESVSPLKEKYGDTFSWEELRMFKASLNLN